MLILCSLDNGISSGGEIHKSASMHFLSVGRQSSFDLKTKGSCDFLMRSTSSNSLVTALESTLG